ncbi:MAG: ATP-binding protein [Mangrovibacterium sp.]
MNSLIRNSALALLCFLLAWGLQSWLGFRHAPTQVAQRVQQHFAKMEKEGRAEFQQLSQLHQEKNQLAQAVDSLKNEGLKGELIFRQSDSLIYYSDHALCFEQSISKEAICTLPNGIYWQQCLVVGDAELCYFRSLKHGFSLHNEFLLDRFAPELHLPDGYDLMANTEGGMPIYFHDGRLAFHLQPSSSQALPYGAQLGVAGLLMLGVVLLIILLAQLIRGLPLAAPWRVLLLLGSYTLLYLLHVGCRFPKAIWDLPLAQPSVFAASDIFPSITALLLFSLLCFAFSAALFRAFGRKKVGKGLIVGASLVLALFYVGMNHLMRALVVSSSFSMQLNRVNQLSLAGCIAYLCIGLLFLSCFLLQLKLVGSSQLTRRKKHMSLVASALLVLLGFFTSWETNVSLVVLFLLSNQLLLLFSGSKVKRGSIFYLICFVALYAFFSLQVIQQHHDEQMQHVRELYAYNKYEGHDADTELAIKRIGQAMAGDSVIADKVMQGELEELEDYVNYEYMSHISSRYHVWLTVCTPDDALRIEPEGTNVSCYAFFEEMLEAAGSPIPHSHFYYIDMPNGVLSYFGKFVYPLGEGEESTLFMQLEARLQEEGLGFPELLTDNSQLTPNKYSTFSFAKYHDGQLISLGGEYPYMLDISERMAQIETGISQGEWNAYFHTSYKNEKGDVVVVSSPNRGAWQSVFAFPYIFLFYFLLALCVVFFGSRKGRRELFNDDLSTRIQSAIVGTLFLSLIFVSAATVVYNLQQYKLRHRADLQEKLKAISQELNYQLSEVEDIGALQASSIWESLGNWSNIFQTDINIYQPDGRLLATSRPALFNAGLSAPQMNSSALRSFQQHKQQQLMQPEHIGTLQYLSAYQVIINDRSETIGYINLPYFMRSDSLRQDVLNFIVAFINLSVLLLFLSIMAALALSNRIVKPLSQIKENLRDMSISKQNKPIAYAGNDEIGELVQEYNRKLTELEQSARLLAQSQREMAWKEMARQVAHEIKNPLTPMKLQIQHLQRAQSAGDINRFNQVFDKVTSMLIEQIDRLTHIANSFSQFAKMPEPQPELLNLHELLQRQIALFEQSENLAIRFHQPSNEQVQVFADGEQLARVFLNVIKNAQQSVPADENAQIDIRLIETEQSVRVSISDNGCGVSEDIAERLFEPNFTTKTSGMGLGLAIVKRSVESAKGKIWFENNAEKGATFFVELPIL